MQHGCRLTAGVGKRRQKERKRKKLNLNKGPLESYALMGPRLACTPSQKVIKHSDHLQCCLVPAGEKEQKI